MEIKNKSAQVTVFIIIGLLVVAAIILILYFTGKTSFISSPAENPEAYLRNCMMASIKEAENIILETNGYPKINSTNYILYNKEKVPYLCTTSDFYIACTPQEPALFSYINGLMERKVSSDTDFCLNKLVGDYEKKGYKVQVDPGNITLKIQKDFISASFGKRISVSRAEDAREISNLEITYGTKLYNLIKLTQEIVNYETTTCVFDKDAWMKYDNSIIIYRTSTSDQTEIYTLRDRLTEREFKFAIKTCVLPAGI
jgi:hypothetical protein